MFYTPQSILRNHRKKYHASVVYEEDDVACLEFAKTTETFS